MKEYKKEFNIQDCKFFNCALNTGKGGCVSTLKIDQKCKEIPETFKDK